jgi:hypothetical protein
MLFIIIVYRPPTPIIVVCSHGTAMCRHHITKLRTRGELIPH